MNGVIPRDVMLAWVWLTPNGVAQDCLELANLHVKVATLYTAMTR